MYVDDYEAMANEAVGVAEEAVRAARAQLRAAESALKGARRQRRTMKRALGERFRMTGVAADAAHRCACEARRCKAALARPE